MEPTLRRVRARPPCRGKPREVFGNEVTDGSEGAVCLPVDEDRREEQRDD
jgi:hypothetical protein